ncbi:MAG: DUF2027 domain-containing protein, partial [Bacteroidia bacterium]|nr:DUF2027 domain-containing protein [Bacteroidia bacterium]
IVAIKSEGEVIVQLSDGMEIPYYSNELIPDNASIIIQSASKSLNPLHSSDNKVVYLAIESNTARVTDADEYFVYLFNLSDYSLYYTYSVGKNNQYQCIAHGNIQSYEKRRIKTVSHQLLKEIDTYQIQIIFYQENLYTSQTPVFETIKINEKTLSSSHFIQHPEFERPVYIIILKENFSIHQAELIQSASKQNIRMHLSEEDWAKINLLKEKQHSFKYKSKSDFHKKKYPEELVLDLHIEEIVEDPGNLSPHQKLQIQMHYFEREFHNAIANHVKKITIIHGVGNGRLKYEIREYLKTIDEVQA